MTLAVRVRARAQTDIVLSAQWHESRRPGLGHEFLDEVEATIARLAGHPRSYPQVHQSLRRAQLRRFPFGVFYHLSHDAAVVIAVMHSSRDPTEWRKRSINPVIAKRLAVGLSPG